MFIDKDVNLQILIEQTAAVSMRPSQYAGWEIGSTASDGTALPKKGAPRLALAWSVPYYKAMRDPIFLKIYETLARHFRGIVERIFLPEQDFLNSLEGCGIAQPWFSLEFKKPLAEFDCFVIYHSHDAAEVLCSDIKRLCQEGSRICWELDGFTDADRNHFIEQVFSDFKKKDLFVLSTPAPARWPLLAYRSDENLHLTDYLKAKAAAGPRPESAAPGAPEGLRRGSGTWGAGGAEPAVAGQRVVRHLKFGPLQCYRLRLSRRSWARFISHLEQVQLIKNVFALSGLSVAATQGKRLKPKLSFGPAISVGWESEAEYVDVALAQPATPQELRERLEACLPLGYQIEAVKRIPCHFPSLEESANWVEFEIKNTGQARVDWNPLVQWVTDCRNADAAICEVRKEKPGNKVDIINLADVLAAARVQESGGATHNLILMLRFGPRKNLKPEKVLETILGLRSEYIKTYIRICRKALAFEIRPGHLRYL